jgi:hypothetical protein
MGCNRLKSPNSGSSEFHEPIYGDVHGSRWMDVFHLTGKHQKGEEKRGFRNRHQDGIIFFTRNAGFGLSGKNLIESTTHVWKLKNINKMGVAPCMHIFYGTSSLWGQQSSSNSSHQLAKVFLYSLFICICKKKGTAWISQPSQEKVLPITRQFSISKPLFKSFAR